MLGKGQPVRCQSQPPFGNCFTVRSRIGDDRHGSVDTDGERRSVKGSGISPGGDSRNRLHEEREYGDSSGHRTRRPCHDSGCDGTNHPDNKSRRFRTPRSRLPRIIADLGAWHISPPEPPATTAGQRCPPPVSVTSDGMAAMSRRQPGLTCSAKSVSPVVWKSDSFQVFPTRCPL